MTMQAIFYKKTLIIGFIVSLICFDIKNVSIVYNMKLSEITKRFQRSMAENSNTQEDPFGITTTMVTQIRKTYNNINQNTVAGLVTAQYSSGSWYVGLETAAGHIKNKFPFEVSLVKERTQMDDLLFSAGYAVSINGHTRITFSGLFGIPVHRDFGLLGVQFGTGHVGLGTQFDVAYAYTDDLDHTILGAIRYVRFLSRFAEACINQKSTCFDVTLGNLMDVLVSSNHTWDNHRWEFGYDGTFAFGSHLEPPPTELFAETDLDEDQLTFLRTTFYTTYAYNFSISEHESGILVGFSVGTDHKPIPFGFRRLLAAWVTWGIKF